MNQSETLYQLINSLTKTEKRYFRLFAKTNRTESNLLRLFDAVTIMKFKNDKQVKENFINHSFIKNLDVLKVHLQKLILQSMRLYHQNSDKERELRDMIVDIKFLLNRSLYSQCSKLLKKTKAIATKQGYNSLLIDILEIEKKFILLTLQPAIQRKKLLEIYIEESNILKNLTLDSKEKQLLMKAKMQPS